MMLFQLYVLYCMAVFGVFDSLPFAE